ncbi:MAG TPA: glycosyltransferase family A protein [Homoserinimonas sp.]|nr:glycosyltransferase family A protein [Homoserinimonas sp.]
MKLSRAKPSITCPDVTVVIPCYNYGNFLPHLVSTVLTQADVDAHVVIVDDASPDGSAAVAERLAAENPRVRALLHRENAGHIRTYNDGLALVDTRYATLVSADDLLAPGALARACSVMEHHPQVGLVYGHAVTFTASTTPSPPHHALPITWSLWRGDEWIRLAARRGKNFIISPEAVLRTSALRQVGGYNSGLPHSGDLEYWLRTAARWDVARVNGTPQAYYRVHGGNMHTTDFGTMALDLRHRLAAFEVLAVPELGVEDSARLLEWARSALADESLLFAVRELDRGAADDEVASLIGLAEELRPGSKSAARGRGLARRIERRAQGASPSRPQQLTEAARQQVDRIRAVVWEVAGIS